MLDAEDKGLSFLTAQSILDGNLGERGHSALSTLVTSMAHAAHTVYEIILSVQVYISEISPLLCDDNYLSMLQPNAQVAFISTKGYGESAIEKLVKLWDQIIFSYLHPGKTWVAGSAIYRL